MRKWIKNIVIQVLLDFYIERGFQNINAPRDPDRYDTCFREKTLWINRQTGKKFILKELSAEWTEYIEN